MQIWTSEVIKRLSEIKIWLTIITYYYFCNHRWRVLKCHSIFIISFGYLIYIFVLCWTVNYWTDYLHIWTYCSCSWFSCVANNGIFIESFASLPLMKFSATKEMGFCKVTRLSYAWWSLMIELYLQSFWIFHFFSFNKTLAQY